MCATSLRTLLRRQQNRFSVGPVVLAPNKGQILHRSISRGRRRTEPSVETAKAAESGPARSTANFERVPFSTSWPVPGFKSAGTQPHSGSEPYLFWAPNYSPVTFVLLDSALTNDVSR